MYNALHDALHSLQATGAEGFEGLVHAQIGRLTDRRFFLAKSGAQAGKDAGTAGYGETYIDIECKRYRRDASPTARDLCGGLVEAIDAGASQLDLWLVVSTGAIGSTEAEALRRTADREAVAVEVIDWQEAGLPQLAILCAAFREETLEELRVRGGSGDLTAVAADLEAVANDPHFPGQLADLQHRLSTADLGFDHARAVANAWIEERLASKADAMAAFHQALCVGDAHFQPYVERKAPQNALNAWYSAWSANPSLAAVLGREGNGKSWATMAWWKGLAIKPLTLVITSNCEIQSDALTLLASTLFKQTKRVRDLDFWQRRLRQWCQRPPSATPTLLLILDGLNERRRPAWDEVFASLAASDWAGHLTAVTTCRPPFWSDHVAPFLPDRLPVTRIEVQPFDDEELGRAWGGRRPALSEIPGDVRDFIRTPRIFRLARDHVERLMESGDLTVERLLIEDWKDRRRLKLGFEHSVADFNNLVIELARDLRQGLGEFGRHQLRNYSSPALCNLDKDFDEIIDGQLFEPVDPVSGKYRVRTEYVSLSLGMLLAREVRDAYRQSGTAGVEHVLAEALDPATDLDQMNATLRGACTMAWLEPGYPVDARKMLLRAWICRRNLDDTQWHGFAAYLPLSPDTFFDLAEGFWFDDDIDPTAREWVTDAILRWHGLPRVKELITERCTRWLGLWHADWLSFPGKLDEDYLARQRLTVSNNRSRLTDPERRLAEQLLSEAPTAYAPSIARLALLLISHGPRLAHVAGFVAWAISRAIMQSPDESKEVAWCLRLNEYDPEETEAAILERVDRLLEGSSELGIQAARCLLWACGTPGAAARLAPLPAPPQQEFRPRRYRIEIEVDPLDPGAPTPADLAPITDRLATLDPANFWGGLGLTAEEHQFDEIEPILARFALREVCTFYRRLLRSSLEREGMRLRQLGWRVPDLLLLIGPEEVSALDKARRALFALLDSNQHDARDTEAYILAGLLGHHTVEVQLDLLLDRPESALDLLILENVVAAVPNEFTNAHIILTTAEGPAHVLRRLLWVLSRSTFTLVEEAHNALVRCFGHPDPSVRASALRLAKTCNDRAALSVHVASEWRAPDNTTPESFYGSLALIAGTNPVDYLALRGRIMPELLGYLALRDGTPRAIATFAEDLDALWETMTQTPIVPDETASAAIIRMPPTDPATPELDFTWIEPRTEAALRTIRVFGRGLNKNELEDFFGWLDRDASVHKRRDIEDRVKKFIEEVRNAGHHFFGKGMRGEALAEVIAWHPELAEKWITFLKQCDTVPWDTAEFYRTLCAALGATDPDRAADILAYLQRVWTMLRVTYHPWNIDSLTWFSFQLPSSRKVDAVRERLLMGAHTDELLFQIALAAQATGAIDWLGHVIQQDLGTSAVHRTARALTLIGFLDKGALLNVLQGQLDGRAGFLKDVATCARGRLERNYRARTWFARFLTHRDPVEAWAAFRLFLRCVDRRFYLWGDAMRKATLDLPLLWHQQVILNERDIRRAAERNEGRLSEVLFGLQISKDEIAPWYCMPPMAVPHDPSVVAQDSVPL